LRFDPVQTRAPNRGRAIRFREVGRHLPRPRRRRRRGRRRRRRSRAATCGPEISPKEGGRGTQGVSRGVIHCWAVLARTSGRAGGWLAPDVGRRKWCGSVWVGIGCSFPTSMPPTHTNFLVRTWCGCGHAVVDGGVVRRVRMQMTTHWDSSLAYMAMG
jgi:hypothetical protein